MANRGAKTAAFFDPAFIAIVLLALALRVPGLFTDFWLDEIWTLKIVYGLDSAFGVFTDVRHSNNHHLNTLIYYWLGDLERFSLYRIHSLVAGVLSIGLAWRIGARAGRIEAIFASGLCATSYLLIHFSSEARGYALVILFALLSFDALERFQRSPSWPVSALFWGSTCLGFLSHLMYLHAFLAGGAWSALALLRGGAGLRRGALHLLRLFGPPSAFLVWFYLFDIRFTKIGEGPEYDAIAVLVRALSYALGGPATGSLAAIIAAATAASWAAAIVWLLRRGRDEWLFFTVVIFVSPAIAFAALRPEVFFVRYFLLGTTFGFLALAYPLAALWRTHRARTVAVLFALVLAGNALNTARFYRHGRGAYLEAMHFLVDESPGRVPTVASDHRFRNFTVIRFYNRYLPPQERLIYMRQDQYPQWLLLHRIGAIGNVEESLHGGSDHRYDLARVFPYSDMSGWHWLVYRLQERLPERLPERPEGLER